MDSLHDRARPKSFEALIEQVRQQHAAASDTLIAFGKRWKAVEAPLAETITDPQVRRNRTLFQLRDGTPDITQYKQARMDLLAADVILRVADANRHEPQAAEQKVMQLLYEANSAFQPNKDAERINEFDLAAPRIIDSYFDAAARTLKKSDPVRQHFLQETTQAIRNELLNGGLTGISRRHFLETGKNLFKSALGGGVAGYMVSKSVNGTANGGIVGVVAGGYTGYKLSIRSAPWVTQPEFHIAARNLADYYQLTLPAQVRQELAAMHGGYNRLQEATKQLDTLLAPQAKDWPSMVEGDNKNSYSLFCDALKEFSTIYDVAVSDPTSSAQDLRLFATGLGVEAEGLMQPLADLRSYATEHADLPNELRPQITECFNAVQRLLDQLHQQAALMARRHAREI